MQMAEFSSQQAKFLRKLFSIAPSSKGLAEPEAFLLQFVLFEASVRLVGRYYRERSGQKKKSTAHESLNIEVVKRSLAYFSIPVSDERLVQLVSSELRKRNQKSARKLRDGLAHQWNVEDRREVTDRFKDLTNGLAGVVDAIRMRAG
ncbi:hypothetical protein LPB67_09345 [Undibacterium sp. Jales W-56]|uniref:hypothetical protein n=1 Tax=Undibacterium sp. Jales W-56 TaxID=2897325 RepID=UPI0021CEA3EF|nr:hypothetical protein [Undibacterium sp. Jales W-56]MCU6433971.1 hypothetical protein [Undibacterium sp. Jales W-56]